MYSMSSLLTYEPVIEEYISAFRQRLAELANAKLHTIIGHWMEFYAFNAIGSMTFKSYLLTVSH